MANPTNAANIKVKPAYAYYGRRGEFTALCIADVAGSLDATYFEFEGYTKNANQGYDLVEYYAYVNTDPVLAGKVGISVSVTSGDASTVVAAAFQAAIDAEADLKCEVSGSTITVKSLYFGETVAAVDTGATGFTFTQVELGYGGSIGCTADAIDFSFTPDLVDILCDQEGTQVLDQVATGYAAEVSMTLIELTLEQYKNMIGRFHGNILSTSGEDVVGIGSNKKFQNLKQNAGELILQPINAADTTDDVYIFSAAPTVESFNFSGTANREMPVTFKAYIDGTKANTNSLFIIGDGLEFI